MGATIRYCTREESIGRSIRAGSGILIFSNNLATLKDLTAFALRYDLGSKTIASVMAAMARRKISRKRIEVSWRRIRALRQRIG